MSPYYGEGRFYKNYLWPALGIGHLAVRDIEGEVTKQHIQDGQQAALDLAVKAHRSTWRRWLL